MARKIAISTINASTIDILNTIRANASAEYQSKIPKITTERDLTGVGSVLYGYPALANEFISSLVNRIAQVRIKSAAFNNPYVDLKKGFLEFGEVVEEVFVALAKAREFSPEKAEARELKRTIPDVRTALHCINIKCQYPITIQNEDLRQAFMSFAGVEDMISKIIDSVYRAAEYDEFLLFKYLMIKGITHGKMLPIAVNMSDIKNAAIKFRGVSNAFTFVSSKYNAAGVHTNTKKEDQYIFMDAEFNAQFDVEVLASAFNMEKADFMGHLKLIDDWTTFDNERFSQIVAETDSVEAVTDAELAIMANVKAVLVDAEFFQIYDALASMTEKYVASGMYWNYFYNAWKVVSTSPFSNAVVFVTTDASITLPNTITATVDSVSSNGVETTIALDIDGDASLVGKEMTFVQDESATEKGVAVHPYGAYVLASTLPIGGSVLPVGAIGSTKYTASSGLTRNTKPGDTLSFIKEV